MVPGARLVVVGTSLGGVEALQSIAAGLPADFAAPVVIAMHVGARPSLLPRLLADRSPLPVHAAEHGQPLRAGHVYVAPADHHVLVDGPLLRLSQGPKEHHSRPAIDPLFRSAALSRGADVIGVVLTGMLDDGTAGLQAIKAAGGVVVVQDPDEAVAPDMPRSALRHVAVDHCRALAAIPRLLARLAAEPAPAHNGAPLTCERHELDMLLSRGNPMEHLRDIAHPSPYVCPDCKGGLWQLDNVVPTRYRCHTGHGFTLRTLLHAQAEASDGALWSAMRALQEKRMLVEELAGDLDGNGADATPTQLHDDAAQLARQVELLRALLEQVPPPVE
jgi:two-component system, chemotaxis family, protein-glutamate methylesterase/glutaminase